MSDSATIVLYNSCANPVKVFIGNYLSYPDDTSENQSGSQISVGSSYTFVVKYNGDVSENNFIEIVSLEGSTYNLYQLISTQGTYGTLSINSTNYYNMIDQTVSFQVVDSTTTQNASYNNTQYNIQNMINLYISYQSINSFISQDCMTGSCSSNYVQLSTSTSSVGCICINNNAVINQNNLKIVNSYGSDLTLYITQVQNVSSVISALGTSSSYTVSNTDSIQMSLVPVSSYVGLLIIYYDNTAGTYGVFQVINLLKFIYGQVYTITLTSIQATSSYVSIAKNMNLQYVSSNIDSFINTTTPCSLGFTTIGTSPDVICVDLNSLYNGTSGSNGNLNYWILIGIIAFILILVVVGVIIYLVVSHKKKKPK